MNGSQARCCESSISDFGTAISKVSSLPSRHSGLDGVAESGYQVETDCFMLV